MRPPSKFSASGSQEIVMLRRRNLSVKRIAAEMLIRSFQREDKKTFHLTVLDI